MMAAMTCFIGSDTLLKVVSSSYPPGQIMALRGVFASLIALGLVAAMGELRHIRGAVAPIVLTRSVVEACVAFLFITALGRLPLANITSILQATPLILTLMAVVLGLERVGWRRWSAVSVGFVGVLLIVKPSPSAFNVYAGLALASAVLVATRDLLTRAVGAHVPSVVIAFSTTTAVGIAGFAVAALGEAWRPLATRELLLLLGAAVFVTGGNLAIIVAMRAGDPSVVAPFRYTIILLSIALGYAVFGDLPDPLSWAGIVLIVASGLYALHREQVRQREAASRREETALAMAAAVRSGDGA